VCLSVLACLGVRLMLIRGVLGRQKPCVQWERDARRRPISRTWTQPQTDPALQREQDREPDRTQQRKRRAANQSEEIPWWIVLEILPDASLDEIRRSYLSKIKLSHPDRVAFLAPESVLLVEARAKTLNAAYAEATRARRQAPSSES